jgi:uncharacterized protein
MIEITDIHIIQKDKRYVVFHPESLSLFYVREDIGKILKLYELNSKYINHDSERVINNILNALSKKIDHNSTVNLKEENQGPRTLNLLVSQDCNIRCGYCYAGHGTYGSEKKLMSYDTARKCIDKLLSKEHENHILFFGGEPLLNFSLIEKLDSYLNKKKLSAKYTMVTNGTIMNDEIKNFINKKSLNLWISLDGPKDINDGQRFGSFESVHDHVIKTIDKLYPRGGPITIKSTVTKRSANRLTEIVAYISSLNIDSMDIRSVKDVSPSSEFFMNDEDYAMYINDLANILAICIKKLANGEKVKMISYIYPILMRMITKTRRINGCSAGRELMTITADGDVYPCEKYTGLEVFHMGNVHDEDFPGEKFKRLRKMFYEINVYKSPYCNACWARFLCGGGCHWRCYSSHGDLSQPMEQKCFGMKSILEALLPEIADIFQDEAKTKNLLNYLKLNKQKDVLTAVPH